MSAERWIELAEEYGTPLYVYDKKKIEERYGKLTSAFEGKDVRFFYACKALGNINILKAIKNMGCGLDTVSINEVLLGIKVGFEPKNIIYTPNCVAFDEIKEAVDLGVHINIDNISILEQFGNYYQGNYPVIIRFNPHIMAGGNYNISTGHIDSKFGISIHQLRHVLRVVKTLNINVEGVHMHTGSEIKDMQVFLQGLEVLLDIAREFPNLKILDLGSGFKVPYKEDEKETDVQKLRDIISGPIEEFQKERNCKVEVWFEPGKYLVSESGTFLVKTNVIKPTPATVFVGVDSGFNHLIRPMLYGSYHRIDNISNPSGTERIYTIVGNLCETDTFAWDRMLTEVNEGDILAFHNAGAYCYEMSMNYNARFKPAEVLVSGEKHALIRKRENMDDLLKNTIEVDFD
ncbi:MAG: diaminopimelate decarboxylase [Chitinophagales bacterium]|jgi:diaminopimelate decarboxylase|nr:diaminopimelate decarboxylase [Sphingobacteriales bacterium]